MTWHGYNDTKWHHRTTNQRKQHEQNEEGLQMKYCIGTVNSEWSYRILPNYRTYSYDKRSVKQFRSLQITASVVFVYFFIKAYVVDTHLNCIDVSSMQFKWVPTSYDFIMIIKKASNKQLPNKNKVKRKVQGVPQSQTAALPRHPEEEETDKTKQAQIEQTYEKHCD